MRVVREYKNKDEYFNHQLEKTTNKNVKKNKTRDWKGSIIRYKELFKNYGVEENKNCLCIGSRYGQEVEALRNMNCSAIGIDLVEFPPYTIVMDMHDLKYDDKSFDVLYSNALDHSWDINKSVSEMFRVAREKVIITILLNNRGNYEVTVFDSLDDIIDIVKSLGIKYEYRLIERKKDYTMIFDIGEKNETTKNN